MIFLNPPPKKKKFSGYSVRKNDKISIQIHRVSNLNEIMPKSVATDNLTVQQKQIMVCSYLKKKRLNATVIFKI